MRALSAVLLLAALPVFGGDYTDGVFDRVTTEIETPHLMFAKPRAGGTLKVLVIGPAWGQRETAELMQRFDFDCQVAMTITHAQLASEEFFLAPERLGSSSTGYSPASMTPLSSEALIGGSCYCPTATPFSNRYMRAEPAWSTRRLRRTMS